jgi:hypothetical protein
MFGVFGNHQASLDRGGPDGIAHRRLTFRPGRHDIPSREVCGVEVERWLLLLYGVIHEFSCDETFCAGFAFRLDYEVLMKDFAIASTSTDPAIAHPAWLPLFVPCPLLSFPCFTVIFSHIAFRLRCIGHVGHVGAHGGTEVLLDPIRPTP